MVQKWPPENVMVEIRMSDYMGDFWQKAKLVKYKESKQGSARFCDEGGNKIASIREVEEWRELTPPSCNEVTNGR